MTAYGASISVENTINNIENSYRRCPFNEVLEAVYKEVQPLQKLLERSDGSSKSKNRKKVNALDGRIKQQLWNFEDSLETLLSDGIVTTNCLFRSNPTPLQFIRNGPLQKLQEYVFSGRVPQLRDAADSLIHALKYMMDEYIHELDHMPDNDEDEDKDGDEEEESASGGTSMIGLSKEFGDVKYYLSGSWYENHSISIYSLVGMAGLGKTALARRIYQDPEIRSYFDCRIWITVGRKYDPGRGISLATRMQGGKRYLIVLDDVWETGVLPIFIASLMEMNDRFIRILITARGRNVVSLVQESMPHTSKVKVLRFLNEDESKELLCERVFGGEADTCPTELDKAAAKIAKNCEGLPLMILTVAKRLSNNRDPDYWNEVAEERNSVFTDSYEEISKVLYPSYDHLPQRLKMLFMFMGVFPRGYDIAVSKILKMCTAEGWLLEPGSYSSSLSSATRCLEELCMSYNLVLFKQKSRSWFVDEYAKGVLKTCRLHSSWRYLCRREARKNKFFHVLNKLVDASPHSQEEDEDVVIKGQRGLCLENNLLFALKASCSSVKSHCASSTRSLLFFGPYHQYPTPLISFKLLRELDALQLRFYTFPTQILTLFQLRYLALTCSDDHLPSTISLLSKLRTLIIHPHLSIVKCHTPPSFIPIEIWDMGLLEHIEILGKSFSRPVNQFNDSFPNLSTLVGVNANISTISDLSERIPYVRKLGVQIELGPNDTSTPEKILSCFDSISTLRYLYTLKISIVNPVHVLPVRPPHTPLLLPQGLEKLHLSGMGFPWEYMDAIASMPNLLVLKLRCHAFRGPKWEIREESFLELKYLEIEDSDLVEWKPASRSFCKLNYLNLKHCYRLRELEWPSRYGKIELEDCKPLAVTCANLLKEKHSSYLSVIASDHYQV